MTEPEKRGDPWKEALNCYKDFADEVIITGQDWPEEFTWDHIGKTFTEGFNKCSGDWVLNLALDMFIHEKQISKNGIDTIKNYFNLELFDRRVFNIITKSQHRNESI